MGSGMVIEKSERQHGSEDGIVEDLLDDFRIGVWTGEDRIASEECAVLSGQIGAHLGETRDVLGALVREIQSEIGRGECEEPEGGGCRPRERDGAAGAAPTDGELQRGVELGGGTEQQGVLVTGEGPGVHQAVAALVGHGGGLEHCKHDECERTAIERVERCAGAAAADEQRDERELHE